MWIAASIWSIVAIRLYVITYTCIVRLVSFLEPDVLVLGGGGILGEGWMNGLLAGLEDATSVRFADCRAFVGTSAGSIVAARLVAGRELRRPGRRPKATPGAGPPRGRVLREAVRVGWQATAPLAPLALAASAPAGAAVRSLALARVPAGRYPLTQLHQRVAGWHARFDGRLRVCTVDRANGRRVVFGAPGAPKASVADAVQASCAIPAVFKPVRIDGREYVDGGAWSVTNLDAAPVSRGSRVLCLEPTGALGLRGAAFRVATEIELQALRRKRARVERVLPDRDSAGLMGVLMDGRPLPKVIAAGYAQGLALAAG
jgi:NTE family protein